MSKKLILEECLYHKTPEQQKEDGASGFGLRIYDCDRCDGQDKDCRLYYPTKPRWNNDDKS